MADPIITPLIENDQQAIDALAAFAGWLAKLPTTWFAPIMVGDSSVTRPTLKTLSSLAAMQDVGSLLVLAWPPQSYQSALNAWNYLATKYVNLETFPFYVYPSQDNKNIPATSSKVDASKITTFNAFLGWARAQTGIGIVTPSPPPPKKAVEESGIAWKIVVGVAVGVTIVGLGYLILRSTPNAQPTRYVRHPRYADV